VAGREPWPGTPAGAAVPGAARAAGGAGVARPGAAKRLAAQQGAGV
jgi:hypothetical protein